MYVKRLQTTLKRKMDFSKKIASVVLLWSLVCVSISYYLANKGLAPNAEVTSNILLYVTAPTITAYLATKTIEKASRNKHGLDENGKPLVCETKDDTNAEG